MNSASHSGRRDQPVPLLQPCVRGHVDQRRQAFGLDLSLQALRAPRARVHRSHHARRSRDLPVSGWQHLEGTRDALRQLAILFGLIGDELVHRGGDVEVGT